MNLECHELNAIDECDILGDLFLCALKLRLNKLFSDSEYIILIKEMFEFLIDIK
jgi:hypothetical protein